MRRRRIRTTKGRSAPRTQVVARLAFVGVAGVAGLGLLWPRAASAAPRLLAATEQPAPEPSADTAPPHTTATTADEVTPSTSQTTDASNSTDTTDPAADPSAPTDPSGPADPNDEAANLAAYEPTDDVDHTEDVLTTVVASSAVATAVAAGAAGSGARGRGKSSQTAASKSGAGASPEFAEVYTGDVLFAEAVVAAAGLGDRSATWRSPLTEPLDDLSIKLPHRLARFAPLLAAVWADGTWLRAIFGSLALAVPAAGVALGVAAGVNAHGTYLPPTLAFVVALTVLGIADAFAGALGAVAYIVTTIAYGGLPSLAQARTILGLVALWFVPVIISAATRPLRRPLQANWASRLDRLGDFVIGPMMAVWCAEGFAYGQNALTHRQVPLAAKWALIGWIVFGALVVRLLAETIVSLLYPARLAAIDPGAPAAPSLAQRTLSLAGRSVMYVVVALAFFPMSWQLVFAVTAMAFGVFGYWAGFVSRLPNSRWLHRWAPMGLPLSVLWLFATEKAVRLVTAHQTNPSVRLLDTFACLGVPTLIFTLLAALGRDGERKPLAMWHRLAAIPLLVLMAHYMFTWFKWIPF